MFEDRTFENIMAEMMADMPDGIDTSDGSLLYNACAKQAVRLEEAYQDLAAIDDNMYPDTADLQHLIRYGNDRGIYLTPATSAEFTAQFNCSVEPGDRFYNEDFEYTCVEELDAEQHLYRLVCEEAGSEPNSVLGEIEPVDFIEDFESGELTECTLPGVDEEDEDVYRSRISNSHNYKGFGGNKEYYVSQIGEYAGVTGVKAYRVSAPTDYISVVIQGADYRAPASALVDDVQDLVDPVVTSGEGDGIAPIGHRVTVSGVEELTVNVEVTLTYDTGYSYEALSAAIQAAVEGYFESLRKAWMSSATTVVRIAQLETALLAVTGILDVENTTLNGSTTNITLPANKVPVLGTLVCH